MKLSAEKTYERTILIGEKQFPIRSEQSVMFRQLAIGHQYQIDDLYFVGVFPEIETAEQCHSMFKKLLEAEACLCIGFQYEKSHIIQKLLPISLFTTEFLGISDTPMDSLSKISCFLKHNKSTPNAYLGVPLTRCFFLKEKSKTIAGVAVSHLITDGQGIINVEKKFRLIVQGKNISRCGIETPSFLLRCTEGGRHSRAPQEQEAYWGDAMDPSTQVDLPPPQMSEQPFILKGALELSEREKLNYDFFRNGCSLQIGLMACFAMSLMKAFQRETIILRSVYNNRIGALEAACSGFYTTQYAVLFQDNADRDIYIKNSIASVRLALAHANSFKKWDDNSILPRTTDFQFIPNSLKRDRSITKSEGVARVDRLPTQITNVASLFSREATNGKLSFIFVSNPLRIEENRAVEIFNRFSDILGFKFS